MSDDQMRVEYEAWAISTDGDYTQDQMQRWSIGDHHHAISGDDYKDPTVEHDWRVWQAAWTRKPAVQVAEAVIAQATPCPHMWEFQPQATGLQQERCSICYAYRCIAQAQSFTTCHPAPEPDAAKVVSVPVYEQVAAALEMLMEDIEEHRGIAYSTFDSEGCAEAALRALAADRERT